MDGEFKIRPATEADVELIHFFIKAIAEYERMADQVECGVETIRESMFRQKRAEALIGELDGKPVGFSLYFHNFSTFVGRAGLYLEDIFVLKEYRGRGYGKRFFEALAKIARERNCGRMEWSCLNWNEPSIEFYRNMGARPMSDWTVYRLNEAQIAALAETQNFTE